MKKTVFPAIFLLYSLFAPAQNYYMAAPEGFGAAATGGGAAIPVVAGTYSDLKAKILDPAVPVILVSGTITVPDGGAISAVLTDKSILGLPGARLVNLTQTQTGSGILYLKDGSRNVIIRNLTFEGPGAYDVDGRDNLTADGCTHLWVDHCEFQDAVDGNFDIRGNSDSITVSWCKFTYLKPPKAGGSGGADDHRFSNLIGSSSSNAPPDGHYSVTFQNCYWADGCRERMPRARNGELHILNCYYNTSVPGSRALGLGGGVNNLTCYVENTDFHVIGTAFKDYSSSDGGTVSVAFSGCLKGGANQGTVAKPTYAYTVLPVAQLAAVIPDTTCGAGATLQATMAGALSSPCAGSTGTTDPPVRPAIRFYPAVVSDTLYIEFPDSAAGASKLSVYSEKGSLVYGPVQSMISAGKQGVDLSALPAGVYFCQVQYAGMSFIQKILKR